MQGVTAVVLEGYQCRPSPRPNNFNRMYHKSSPQMTEYNICKNQSKSKEFEKKKQQKLQKEWKSKGCAVGCSVQWPWAVYHAGQSVLECRQAMLINCQTILARSSRWEALLATHLQSFLLRTFINTHEKSTAGNTRRLRFQRAGIALPFFILCKRLK